MRIDIVIVALRRLLAMRFLMVVWLVGATLTTALVVNVQLFSEAASLRVLRDELEQASQGRPPFALHLYRPWDPYTEPTGQGYAAYQQVSDFLHREHGLVDLPLLGIVGRAESPPFRVSVPGPDAEVLESVRGLRYRLGFTDAFSEHVLVVEGRMPQPGADAGGAIEVLASWYEAMRSGLWIGDQYLLTEDTQGASTRAPAELTVKVIGLWRARDESEDYWFTDPKQWTHLLMLSERTYAQAVAPHLERPVGFCSWYVTFDDGPIRASQVSKLRAGMTRLIAQAAQPMPGIRSDLYSPLAALEAFEARYRSLLLTLSLFNVPVVGATVYAMITISGLIVSAQRAEVATLRSRGASRDQVLGIYFLQAALVALIALPSGLLLARTLAQWMGTVVSFLSFARRSFLQVTLELRHVGLGALCAVLVALATTMPARGASAATIVSHARERAREQKRPFWERYLVDLWLLVPALYGYWQIRRSNAIGLLQRRITAGDTAYTDPLMYVVPVLFLFSATMLLMRLLPLVLRLVAYLTSRFSGPPLYLSLVQLSRHPRYYTGPLILLVFMVGLGVYTANLARTLDTNLRDRIYYAVGTDMVLVETPPGGARTLPSDPSAGSSSSQAGERDTIGDSMWVLPFEVHRTLPGVRDAARVGRYRTNLRLERDANPIQFMAIEPHDFMRVAFFRPDFATETLETLMSRLAAQPHNVLVPRSLVDRAGVEIGEQIRFGLDVVGAEEWVSLPFVICGVYDYFPTVYPGERMVIVGNMAYLVNQIGGIGHYHAWLRTDPDARSTEIVDLVQRSLPIDVPTVQNARQLVLEKERLPERVGFFGTLSAGFVGVGGLAIVSYSLFAFLSLQRRSIEIGVLHAIGLTRASVARSLIYEQSVMLISAVLGAVGLGLLTAYRFVPLVEVGQTQREQVPPYIHHIAWSDLALMMAIVACVLVMAMAIVGYVVVRQRIGETLKLADL